jgi:hypothetical protein
MEPILPPNPKSVKLVYMMKIMMWIQFSIGVTKMIIGLYNPLTGITGFSELFATMILYMAYSQLSFCGCIVYIFFCLLNIVTTIAIIGQRLQNEKPIFTEKPSENAAMIINIISLFFYVCSVICTFHAYREFKAISIEMGGSYEGLGLLTGPGGVSSAGPLAGRNYAGYGATGRVNKKKKIHKIFIFSSRKSTILKTFPTTSCSRSFKQ